MVEMEVGGRRRRSVGKKLSLNEPVCNYVSTFTYHSVDIKLSFVGSLKSSKLHQCPQCSFFCYKLAHGSFTSKSTEYMRQVHAEYPDKVSVVSYHGTEGDGVLGG